MSDNNADQKQQIQVHIPPDLDYHYRDIANVFVGPGDVVIEFGNFHRSNAGNATISNRIVLSVGTAYQLQESLAQALAQAQQAIRQQVEQEK